MSKLISYEMATQLLVDHLPPRRTEAIALRGALGRVLASNIVADQDIPGFNRAVMDGYAVRSCDASESPSHLRLVGEIPAGQSDNLIIGSREAAAIMTGAPLPKGADAVVMIEETERCSESTVTLHTSVRVGENVAAKGSEVRKGTTVIKYGQPIGPAHVAILATFGKVLVEVFAAPKIGILPTGSEVVDVDEKPSLGQIRNSNAPMLEAQSQRLGVKAEVLPVVGDDLGAMQKAIRRGLAKTDILVLTGGVSMGRHDLVPDVLKAEGVDVIFHKATIKPGKPVLVGRIGAKLIFGLPGNPVSSFVTFELFVRPAVRHWMGFKNIFLAEARARLELPLHHRAGRTFFAPGLAAFSDKEITVRPVKTAGSADIAAFSSANCLIVVPANCTQLDMDQSVNIMFLEDLFQGGSPDET